MPVYLPRIIEASPFTDYLSDDKDLKQFGFSRSDFEGEKWTSKEFLKDFLNKTNLRTSFDKTGEAESKPKIAGVTITMKAPVPSGVQAKPETPSRSKQASPRSKPEVPEEGAPSKTTDDVTTESVAAGSKEVPVSPREKKKSREKKESVDDVASEDLQSTVGTDARSRGRKSTGE